MTRTVTPIRLVPRLAPPPRTEPPYDDEIGISPAAPQPRGVTQGTLALTFTLPSGVPARPRLQLVPSGMRHQPRVETRPGAHPQPLLPDPRTWAGTLAQAVVEVLAGDRPVGQLLRWTTARIYADVSRQAATTARECTAVRAGRARAVVRKVCVSQPVDGVAEASAVVSDGGRARAMALRLQSEDGRWLCTALELG